MTPSLQRISFKGSTCKSFNVNTVVDKVCVNGLHNGVDEALLRTDFTECGTVTAVTLVAKVKHGTLSCILQIPPYIIIYPHIPQNIQY